MEDEPPATLNEMRRSLAYYIQEDLNLNENKLGRLWRALRIAIVGIALEVTFWLLGIVI